ncbi:MAG: GNAT family N-acetyltransferase [Actinomycetia bacterium]|nr:GNAT family N-acetyltransferase [Actinomycetes bacterium]
MPQLSPPTAAVHHSFLAAMAEFAAEGRGGPRDDSVLGDEMRRFAATWTTRDGFAAFVAALRADSLDTTPRPPGFVPATTYWWIDGEEYLARIVVRHRLTPHLLATGGHIGYDVRPTARRRGHATEMLRAALPIAHRLGVSPALLTCDITNVASMKVIEANGGQRADEGEGIARYWVPTAPLERAVADPPPAHQPPPDQRAREK